MSNVGTLEKAPKKIQSFTDLYAWQEGHKFVLKIYEITAHFPEHERFGLTSQLQRAAVSVTSNIAEGFRGKSKKEKCRFYRISLSSLTECQNQLLIARDVHYIDQESFQKSAKQSVVVSKLTMGLIKGAVSH